MAPRPKSMAGIPPGADFRPVRRFDEFPCARAVQAVRSCEHFSMCVAARGSQEPPLREADRLAAGDDDVIEHAKAQFGLLFADWFEMHQ